jgi:hypothetical protein
MIYKLHILKINKLFNRKNTQIEHFRDFCNVPYLNRFSSCYTGLNYTLEFSLFTILFLENNEICYDT